MTKSHKKEDKDKKGASRVTIPVSVFRKMIVSIVTISLASFNDHFRTWLPSGNNKLPALKGIKVNIGWIIFLIRSVDREKRFVDKNEETICDDLTLHTFVSLLMRNLHNTNAFYLSVYG